jgi:hypothetical protein
MDGCARGPASLACFGGGAPGECIREVDPSRQNMQVTCAASPANEASAIKLGGPALLSAAVSAAFSVTTTMAT